MFLNTIKKDFMTPEENGRKIGFFRFIVAMFGGLIISYLAVVLLAVLLPTSKSQSLIVSLYIYTFVWACCFLWIILSITKYRAFLKVLILTIIFSVMILILN